MGGGASGLNGTENGKGTGGSGVYCTYKLTPYLHMYVSLM